MNFDDTLTSCILLVQFMKLQQKNKAIELRKKGKSYKEILNHVNVSKGTLSLWLRDVKLSEKQKARLYGLREKNLYKLAKNKQKQRIAQTRAIIRSAKSSIHRLTQKDLLLIGVALYWAEGDKSKKTEQVKFTNSDPQMIALIMRWCRDVCNVKDEKIRIALHIHDLHSEEKVKKFWSIVTGINLKQFHKTQIKASSIRHRRNKLYNGTCSVRINDRALFRKIRGWKLGMLDKMNISITNAPIA